MTVAMLMQVKPLVFTTHHFLISRSFLAAASSARSLVEVASVTMFCLHSMDVLIFF